MNFTGVAFAAIADRVITIAASDGAIVYDADGLTLADIAAFLHVLKTQNSKLKTELVAYDFCTDIELLLRDCTDRQKDVFFGLIAKKEEAAADTPLAEKPEVEIEVGLFTLSYFAGKILRVATGKRCVKLFDIKSYFEGCSLQDAAREYLRQEGDARIDRETLPLWAGGVVDEIASRTIVQAKTTRQLAEKVAAVIVPLEINVKSWYGPSAIAGTCLNKWGARKQSRRLTGQNSPAELQKAIDCALFGGRVEMLKLGTIQDVRTVDLNSAYAYAITFLSQFYAPLRFTRKYSGDENPFSLWLVDYELPKLEGPRAKDQMIGILPTRRGSTGGIYFGQRGRGYFWQPEVDYLVRRYPDCFTVRWGFFTPEYKAVTFAGDVREMYGYRQGLKEAGDKGEKIIKLALSNLYGKFAQNKGVAYYQCRAWAGWITSFVRRLMLDAITGIEDSVICFCQDAIHTTGADSQVPVGPALGEWKRKTYSSGLYIAPGIYDLQVGNAQAKSASRGSNLGLDFVKLASDLSDRQWSELQRQFFVGWQMARQNPIKYGPEYLSEVVETLDLIPGRIKSRNYETIFDWQNDSRSSTISRRFSGLLSARYVPQDHSSALRLKLKDQGWS